MGDIVKERELEILITGLMYEHLPVGWSWQWDKSLTRWGQCAGHLKRLSFSKPLFMHHDIEEARHTILHEIAHALVGCKAKHGPVWKAKCVELGIEATTHHPNPSTLVAGFKYKGTCPNGHVKYKLRRSARMLRASCGECSDVFDPQYRFKWSELI